MDAYLLTRALERPKETYETLLATADGDKKVVVVEKKSPWSFTMLLQLVLSIAISVYATYLSWNCSKGESMPIRIISAVFAYMFGVIYILYYVLFKSSSCKLY